MKFFVKKNIEIHFQKHLGTKIKMMAGNPILRRNICRLSQTHEKWSVMTGATISKPFTKLSLPSSSKTNDITG